MLGLCVIIISNISVKIAIIILKSKNWGSRLGFPGLVWRRNNCFPKNSKLVKYEKIDYEMADKFFKKYSNMSHNIVI